MNFLAHFHLAGPDERVIAGALEGDFYKGRLQTNPPPLAVGIALHRSIDHFTDNHERVAALRRAFPAHLRRYCGILIDLAFDYCLSTHWSNYSSMPLKVFNDRVLQILRAHQHSLGPEASAMLARMEEHDILNLYQHWSTVPAAARNIGNRFKRGNPFLNLEATLEPLHDDIEDAFLMFYPELQTHSKMKLAELFTPA